jgi:hypothetical protein
MRSLSAALFGVSTAFPIAASLLPGDTPPWLGIADVVIALLLVLVGIRIMTRRPGPYAPDVRVTAFRILQGSATLLLVLLAVFLLVGDALRWNVLLPGLAWRAWLFAMALPSWLALRPDDAPTRRP